MPYTVLNQKQGKNWTLFLGDSCVVTKGIPDNSVDMSIFSPPFDSLFVFSDLIADMSNSSGDEFTKHFRFLVKELLRVTAPGRLCVVHCMDLPIFKHASGKSGLRDFPGEIIRAFVEEGWAYHSKVTIWKNPKTEMHRTKSHGLLHKTFEGDSASCRQGVPDYLVVFKKHPTEGQTRVIKDLKVGEYIGTDAPPTTLSKREHSIAVWERYASPVWFDIDQGRVLNVLQSKSNHDEKHISPLQLDVIGRCIHLWSNEGDVIFSPFAGIGSEGYEAIRLDRKFVGIELKEEYYNVACQYLEKAELERNTPMLL